MMTRTLPFVAAVVMLACSFAAAAPLNLEQEFPDINAPTNLTTSYDATTDMLTVVTAASPPTAFQFREFDGAPQSLFSGRLTISVKVDENGDLVADPGNTLTIESLSPSTLGNVPANQTLLVAQVVDFGFSFGTTAILEFVGDLTFLNSQPGFFEDFTDAFASGTILTVGQNDYVNWSTSWSSTTNAGFADTFVPEPASLALMAAGGLLLVRRRIA